MLSNIPCALPGEEGGQRRWRLPRDSPRVSPSSSEFHPDDTLLPKHQGRPEETGDGGRRMGEGVLEGRHEALGVFLGGQTRQEKSQQACPVSPRPERQCGSLLLFLKDPANPVFFLRETVTLAIFILTGTHSKSQG